MNKESNQKGGGPTLQILISDCGLTQEKLARLMDVTSGTINSWACGRKVPRTDHFLNLCRILGVSPKALAGAMGFNIDQIPDDVPDKN